MTPEQREGYEQKITSRETKIYSNEAGENCKVIARQEYGTDKNMRTL
jgi:hypothetical protein